MNTSRRKRRAKKKRNTTNVHVVAVAHPPSENTTLRQFSRKTAYVTGNELSDFGQRVAALIPSVEALSEMSRDELKELLEKVSKPIETLFTPIADGKVWLAVAQSVHCEALYRGVYESTNANAIYPMMVFRSFHALGLYPPKWVLDWLDGGFDAYLGAEGKMSLDSVLGTKRKKGQTPVFKEKSAVDLESKIMQEIGELTLLGIPILDAAHMVKMRLSQANCKCPSADTLADRFVKRGGWSKIYKVSKPLFAKKSLEQKKRRMSMYPKDTIPPKFK